MNLNELIAGFREVATASVADAVDQIAGKSGLMNNDIRPRTNENKIVTRFELDAVQISFEAIEPLKTEYLDIKLHASIVKKDGESILAGIRGSDEDYKGVATEYNELDLIGNTEIFKLLYRGGYDIEAYIMPHSSTVIPIAKNQLYNENNEETLIRCIVDLMDNHEANIPKGEVFSENAYRTG